MFNVIRDSIEELLARRWPGIRYTLYVPCGNGECKGNFKLRALIEHAKRGLNEHHCDECFSPRPVNQLLLGYYGPTDILERLGNIEQEISQARSDLDIVKTFGSDLRLIKRVLSTEVIDCPRLFTIRPDDVRQWDRARFWQSRWRLCLWCEEHRMEHPIEPAYVFAQPREWFQTALPYVRLVTRTLSLAVPIAAEAVGVAAGGLMGSRRSELELTKAILAVGGNLPESAGTSEFSATSAEAASLRMFREFLFELDPHKGFAGLRQVTTAAGERLYVCEEHFKAYNPGLPAMGR
jgi:internalin A